MSKNVLKYLLLDKLDELRSTQRMIELYDKSYDLLDKFRMDQYREIRKRVIRGFNATK